MYCSVVGVSKKVSRNVNKIRLFKENSEMITEKSYSLYYQCYYFSLDWFQKQVHIKWYFQVNQGKSIFWQFVAPKFKLLLVTFLVINCLPSKVLKSHVWLSFAPTNNFCDWLFVVSHTVSLSKMCGWSYTSLPYYKQNPLCKLGESSWHSAKLWHCKRVQTPVMLLCSLSN